MPILSSRWLLALPPLLLSSQAFAQDGSGMSSGGLAPPPAVEPAPETTGPTPTEQELTRADKEDSGRGLEFVWLNAEAGFQHLGLQTFHANKLVDAQVVQSTQSGLLLGAGAGVRLIFLTAGARFRLGSFSAWQLWTLDAELGLRIPLGALEPYFTFAGGYARMGSFDASSAFSTNDINVRGFNLRGAFGLDYYLARSFSLGANLSGDVLFLSRPKVTQQPTGNDPQGQAAAQVYAQDGTSIGAGFAVTAVAGLHF
jgi:hypothetical protein